MIINFNDIHYNILLAILSWWQEGSFKSSHHLYLCRSKNKGSRNSYIFKKFLILPQEFHSRLLFMSVWLVCVVCLAKAGRGKDKGVGEKVGHFPNGVCPKHQAITWVHREKKPAMTLAEEKLMSWKPWIRRQEMGSVSIRFASRTDDNTRRGARLNFL